MARLEVPSNHKLEFINNIYIKFHEINPPNTRTYIPRPKKLFNKNAIIDPQKKMINAFYMQLPYLFIMMKLIKNIQTENLKIY